MAAGYILSTNFQKDLLPGLQEYFELDPPQWESKFDKIFDVKKTTERFAEDVVARGFGLMPVKPENAAFAYDGANEGWIKRYEQVVYGKGFIISREARDDGHALDLGMELTKALKRSALQTREVVHANILNNGFSSSYVGGDNVALFATTHPTAVAGNLKNKPSTDADMSEAALEQAVIDIRGQLDEAGLKMYLDPGLLIIPQGLEFVTHRVIKSVLQTASADNTPNALRDKGHFQNVLVNPWLTAAQAFFIKVNGIDKGLRSLERNALELTEDGDFDTENAKYKARMRFVAGWSDWRGAYGVNGP